MKCVRYRCHARADARTGRLTGRGQVFQPYPPARWYTNHFRNIVPQPCRRRSLPWTISVRGCTSMVQAPSSQANLPCSGVQAWETRRPTSSVRGPPRTKAVPRTEPQNLHLSSVEKTKPLAFSYLLPFILTRRLFHKSCRRHAPTDETCRIAQQVFSRKGNYRYIRSPDRHGPPVGRCPPSQKQPLVFGQSSSGPTTSASRNTPPGPQLARLPRWNQQACSSIHGQRSPPT